jgi:hypothetical protein
MGIFACCFDGGQARRRARCCYVEALCIWRYIGIPSGMQTSGDDAARPAGPDLGPHIDVAETAKLTVAVPAVTITPFR